ncbi:hypothetical protein ACQU0X_23990 [Pseudovibrio ascidiaceicola]|uniref:hypothetical protein n=1 Tax=Pseudovibrio ascidiaceicola TaxID=285279 RepID=UPI003D35E5BA
MNGFKFGMEDKVQIKASGEIGLIKGRAQHANACNGYRLHYKGADGRAVYDWWDETDLELVTVADDVSI